MEDLRYHTVPVLGMMTITDAAKRRRALLERFPFLTRRPGAEQA